MKRDDEHAAIAFEIKRNYHDVGTIMDLKGMDDDSDEDEDEEDNNQKQIRRTQALSRLTRDQALSRLTSAANTRPTAKDGLKKRGCTKKHSVPVLVPVLVTVLYLMAVTLLRERLARHP